MKLITRIALETGHIYELPTQVIAENRAKTMQELHPDEFKTIEESMADTVELFDDAYEVSDWAKNNMNPNDYMGMARLVRFTPPTRDFSNAAEWTQHDAPTLVGELSGAEIMQHPVESVLGTMAASRQMCSMTVLNGEDGKPYAMVALIIGAENVVNTYLKGIAYLSDQIVASDKQAEAAMGNTQQH